MNAWPSESQIRQELEKRFSDRMEFAYLLGSAGTDRFRDESDIDLAIYWKSPLSFSELSKIQAELEATFQRDVDLISLNAVDVIFARQVMETGRLLIVQSPGKLLQWKTEQLSRYPDFKYSRRIIEENILKRKKYV